jgi:hypothetical protein
MNVGQPLEVKAPLTGFVRAQIGQVTSMAVFEATDEIDHQMLLAR